MTNTENSAPASIRTSPEDGEPPAPYYVTYPELRALGFPTVAKPRWSQPCRCRCSWCTNLLQSSEEAKQRRRLTFLLTAAFASTFQIAAAYGDVARGRALAQQWCSECHSVAPNRLSGNSAAPSFKAVAAETLYNCLWAPCVFAYPT